MPGKIKWKMDVAVESGPSISSGDTLTVEAYDYVKVDVPGGDATTPGKATVEVQPSGTGKVQFLIVKSDLYNDKLTYQVDASGTDIKLDSAQVFIGAGSIGLLGATTKQFVFTNKVGTTSKAAVEILVGRKAT